MPDSAHELIKQESHELTRFLKRRQLKSAETVHIQINRAQVVRFWRRENGVRCIGEEGEKKEELARNSKDTSGWAEVHRSGRQRRVSIRSVGVEEGDGDTGLDLEGAPMKNLYLEKEESEAELLVVSDRREVAGASRSPAGISVALA